MREVDPADLTAQRDTYRALYLAALDVAAEAYRQVDQLRLELRMRRGVPVDVEGAISAEACDSAAGVQIDGRHAS